MYDVLRCLTYQLRVTTDCQAKLILTEEKINLLRVNPLTLSMWSGIIPFVVTKRKSPSIFLLFRGAQGNRDEGLDEVCVDPEGKSAILQFHFFTFHVLFSVASHGT